MADVSSDQGDRRLNGWKEIAAFFGKDERTVKRWESARGLPVRRLPGGVRTPVFAYVAELREWLDGAGAAGPIEATQPAEAPAGGARSRWRQAPAPLRLALIGLPTILLAALLSGALLLPRGSTPAHQPSPAAEERYLAGVYDWNRRSGDGLRRAIDEFGAAIALEPDYARAYAGLANAYNLLSQYTSAPAAESYARARAAAEKAVALAPDLAEGHAALGFNLFYGAHSFKDAFAEFDRALALDPASAQTLHWYALTLMHMGRFERPLQLIAEAQKLDPASRSIRANRALLLFHAGRPAEALEILEKLREDSPDYLATPSYLATIYLNTDRPAAYLAALDESARIAGDEASIGLAAAARAGFTAGGRAGMLTATYEAAQDLHRRGLVSAYRLAVAAALAGSFDDATRWLAAALDAGEAETIAARIEPAFRPLWENAAYRASLSRIGLPLP